MSIVAIVSKSEENSAKLAEYTAAKLGYRLLTMDGLIEAAAEDYNIPVKELSQTDKDKDMAFLQRLRRNRTTKQVVLLEKKLCELIAEDKIVFCGYFGHSLFLEISHVLKVLVLAHPANDKLTDAGVPKRKRSTLNSRIANWITRTSDENIEDPNHYDLALNLWRMEVAEAGDIIVKTLNQKCFDPMTYSLNCLNNLTLSCQVKSALIDNLADVEVKSHDGTVYVYSKTFRRWRQKAAQGIKDEVMRMSDVKYVEVYGDRSLFDNIHEPADAKAAG